MHLWPVVMMTGIAVLFLKLYAVKIRDIAALMDISVMTNLSFVDGLYVYVVLLISGFGLNFLELNWICQLLCMTFYCAVCFQDDGHIIKTSELNNIKRKTPVRCDDESECPDGNTCCKLADSSWGCCPIPNAMCCDDHIHCCPEGSVCDSDQAHCSSKSGKCKYRY